jgi:site-specific recombinase XerD
MDFSLRLDTASWDLVMMLPQCSHITRKRGVYYYRRRLPGDAKREIAVSLRTRLFREAQWLAAKLDQMFRKLMSSVKYEKPADLQRIARQYLKSKLEHDIEVRTASPHVGVYSRSTDRIVADDLEWIESELQTAKTELRERLYRHQKPLIDELMQAHSIAPELRDVFSHAILQANVDFWVIVRERTVGDFSAEPEGIKAAHPIRSNAVSTEVASAPGPLLSEILASFLDYMSKHEGWRGQTLAQNKTSYAMFVECCGDMPVTAYERKHLAAFYDLLRALPKLYSKSAAWRGLPLAEIAARTRDEDYERLAMKTVKRHFAALGRLFAYLKERGEYQGENPAYGFKFPDKGRARHKRSMWEGEPLRKLFASPVWTGCSSEARRSRVGKFIIKDEKYWLPLLGLYHGNRLEEFAQLHRSDVRHEEGIWFLDINDEGDKQVKNEQSKRRVPLHPELLRLGFLKYVETIAPKENDRVFPLLRPGGPDNKLGFFFTKWWSRYRKDVGVYQKGLDYHSFRAGVATKLAVAGVSLEVRNELLGHEGKSTDERNYQKGFSLTFLAEASSKVSWPEVQL